MNTTPRIPACRPRRSLLALAAAAAAFGAQAVPISVSISGLPPGLAPVLDIQRSTCPGSQVQWLDNPSQPLTEFSHTVIEPVTLPGGQTTLRSRVITGCTASFNTQRTPGPDFPQLDVRCSSGPTDLFHFSLRVPGLGNDDQPASTVSSLDHARQGSSETFNHRVAAKTTSFSPTLNTLSRGVSQTVETRSEASIGTVHGQRLDFLRPSTASASAFNRVAACSCDPATARAACSDRRPAQRWPARMPDVAARALLAHTRRPGAVAHPSVLTEPRALPELQRQQAKASLGR